MSAGDKTATWKLNVDADGRKAAEAAADLERFKDAIRSSKDAIDRYRISMRDLKGTDDAAKAARETLKAKIIDEQNAISRANIGMRKAQATYEAVNKRLKEAKDGHSGLKDAIVAVGGPVADVKEKFETWSNVLGGTTPLTAGLVAGLAAVVLAFVALTAAVVAGTVALAKFTLESGNILRAQGLMREAVTGSADDAARLGHQLDYLSSKLATPREKLNDLAVSIRKSFDGTRMSGQGIVDTITAVASASEAAGDDVGRTLQGILERSKQFGRVGINPFELRGTGGPQFQDIAASLAKNMKIGVDQARQQLMYGLVPIDKAAAAIKDAVDARFGAVNAKKLLDLNVIMAKFNENLVGLTRGAGPALEPILAGLKQMADLFSQSTVEGQALQGAITTFAEILGGAFKGAMPTGISLIQQAIISALKFSIVMVDAAQKVVDFAHSTAGIETINGALMLMKATAVGVGLVVAALGAIVVSAIGVAVVVLATFGQTFLLIYNGAKAAWDLIAKLDWAALGQSIVDGIKRGITAAVGGVKNAVLGVAQSVKSAFAGALQIQSPSKVFEAYGQNTAQGYAQGVQAGAPEAQQAVVSMVRTPGPNSTDSARSSNDGSPSVPGGALSSRPEVKVIFNIDGGASSQRMAATLQSQGVLDGITHAVEIGCRALGIPTQTPEMA